MQHISCAKNLQHLVSANLSIFICQWLLRRYISFVGSKIDNCLQILRTGLSRFKKQICLMISHSGSGDGRNGRKEGRCFPAANCAMQFHQPPEHPVKSLNFSSVAQAVSVVLCCSEEIDCNSYLRLSTLRCKKVEGEFLLFLYALPTFSFTPVFLATPTFSFTPIFLSFWTPFPHPSLATWKYRR